MRNDTMPVKRHIHCHGTVNIGPSHDFRILTSYEVTLSKVKMSPGTAGESFAGQRWAAAD